MMLDLFVSLGAAIYMLDKALVNHPELELRVRNGVIELWNGDECTIRTGVEYVEPLPDDWERVASVVLFAKEPVH